MFISQPVTYTTTSLQFWSNIIGYILLMIALFLLSSAIDRLEGKK